MQKNPGKPKLDSFLIAIIFLVSGITFFNVSVFLDSQIIAFIGLGLTFWGALFLLIPPPKHVEASFLITSSLSNYMTIDRMLNYLVPKNEAYNIPPCPKDVELPEHLEGLKEAVTFIPGELTSGMAEIEDIARSKFLIEKPKGLLITSPGIGILERIEQKHSIDFSTVPLSKLGEMLPDYLGDLLLTKEVEMTTNENKIILQIRNSLYRDLYSQKYNLKSINLLGCPLVNAAACAIAKSTGKPTMIQEIKTTPNGKTTTATFKTVDRKFEPYKELTEINGQVKLRENELLKVINASIGIVDSTFGILIGLQKKRINWKWLENYSNDFGENFIFTGQSMPAFNLSFHKISSAIKAQNPKETSKEANNILKVVYGYFESLSLDDDLKDSVPNFLSAKAIVSSYYALNDLFLARAVGDQENKKEMHQLVSMLQILADNTDFKVDIEELVAIVDKVIPENDLESVLDNVREIFKEQLNHMSLLHSRSLSKK
jgi:hypothetical protein